MLHVINANTGVENFAYIPSMLIPKLSKLTNKPYIHTHFVDGPVSVARMDISGTEKIILVGGLGAGGKGLYALDVTTPTVASETDAASRVLWEITATGDFANLGHTYGTPVFTKLADGTAVVIIGNGYVNTGNGHAVLYVINANTGALISAIDTGSGSVDSPNGLSTPTLYDADGDSRPEYAYAGDIDGNLWKFDLTNNTSSLLFTTSPAQAITTAPVVRPHPYPYWGQMVAFATGRILSSGDKSDAGVHYAYGIWDGAPDVNNQLVTQTFTTSAFGGGGVRTITDNMLDWSTGSGHSMGWRVALPPGERVVGEMPFYNSGRFYFLSTNPTLGNGENWLNELVFQTGGSPGLPIFDLNEDGSFNNDDLADNGAIPVSKYLGEGVFSQPLLVKADGLSTTLYAYHPDLPISDGVPTLPEDPGVSGGHFDYDIYYYGPASEVTEKVPTEEFETALLCKKTNDIAKELDKETNKCKDHPDISDGYTYLSDYSTGAICKDDNDINKIEYWQTLYCNQVVEITYSDADYKKITHVHEYDDKYDVTGVNMLNASLINFNLDNAIPDPLTEFKVLVMNQFLNPAAKLSVGTENRDYISVKTYGGLASTDSPGSVLDNQPTFSRATIGTFIFNLPLDAFQSKDWWGDGGAIRAGLIPTQTGCVNGVSTDGVVEDPGKFDERFNGALTFQLIEPNTPEGHIELNGPDITYGWRVKTEFFKQHVLAEYTTFWHHPNGECYHEDTWVQDPPQDFDFSTKTETKEPYSSDPADGIFGAGLYYTDATTLSDDGLTTTLTRTYSDGTTYTRVSTSNDDGSVITHSVFRDGEEEWVSTYTGNGGEAGFIDPNTGSPEEELSTGTIGRQSWRDLLDDG